MKRYYLMTDELFDCYEDKLDNSSQNFNLNLNIEPVRLPREVLDHVNRDQEMKELCTMLGYHLFIKWLYTSNYIDFETYKCSIPAAIYPKY